MNRKKTDEKEVDKYASSALMKEMISKWIDLQNCRKISAETVITNRAVITNKTVNIFNDNVMAHFIKKI